MLIVQTCRLQHKEQTEAFQSDIKKQTVYVDSLTSEIDGLKTRYFFISLDILDQNHNRSLQIDFRTFRFKVQLYLYNGNPSQVVDVIGTVI